MQDVVKNAIVVLFGCGVAYWLYIVTVRFVGLWRSVKIDAELLIESLLKNAEANLGYPPDPASVVFLAGHKTLSAKLWGMVSAGGAAISGGYGVPRYGQDCTQLLNRYVRNDAFRRDYPCAHAVIQYAVYLCDGSLTSESRCGHPRNELEARLTKRT